MQQDRLSLEISRKRLLLYFALWLGATIFAIAYFTNETKVMDLYRLKVNGVRTGGKVKDKDYENHHAVKYSYQVDGITYEWGGHAGDIGKSFDQISIGESVPIVYDPVSPAISTLGDAQNSFLSELRLTVFGSLIPTLGTVILAIASVMKRSVKR